MASIGARTINLVEDKYLSIANEEYVRQLSIGSNWTKLRLGMMCALTPNGTGNLLGCSLVFGLCSAASPFANTTGYASATTGNFIGMDVIISAGGSNNPGDWVYNAGSGNPYFSGTFTAVRRRYGSTATFAAFASGGSQVLPVAGVGSTVRRGLVYLDITKGSPNYTLKPYNCTTAQGTMDFTPAQFLDGLEQSGTPVVNGQTLLTETAVNHACDESAGAFNTLDLYWNRAAYALEVYALAVYRAA